MKIVRSLLLIFFASIIPTLITAQWAQTSAPERDRPSQQPVLVRPLTHPHGLSKASIAAVRPFYKSKSRWQHIIDSTWGPGLPLADKLAIFDSYSSLINNEFDGFLSLGLNWDSLRTLYRSKIDSTTSRGRFAAIMARLAMSLRDGHTFALDTIVTYTPLAPGVPLLVLSPFSTAEHFGAVLTSLADSSALVLRTVPNHPLGIVPGDIILGYEGVPWKRLVKELLDAELPMFWTGVGASSAETHALLRNVGNNWHLFETIDILKYSTNDTVHLAVSPLMGLSPDPMTGNEQLDISGIPSAFYFVTTTFSAIGQPVNYGKLPATDIGYIRLLGEFPTSVTDAMIAEAVNALWNTKGLVIDMRWNSGGWALFDQAFARMFSQHIITIEDAYRAGPTTFNLVAANHSSWFDIPGEPGSIYDRPIAVLLGPTCVSMGDITAQRLRYHPMVRFFGKPPIGSLGDNKNLTGYQDWYLRYSFGDMFHVNQPGVYLNRREFPIDEPVWFNPDDVAKGIDPVLSAADNWIKTVAHAYSPVTERINYGQRDTIVLTVRAYNPLKHGIALMGTLLHIDNTVADSAQFFNDGLHGDGAPNDSVWGCFLNTHFENVNRSFYYSIRCNDKTAGISRELLYTNLLTTPVPKIADQLPTEFALQQNYPNPFNPTTVISYQLPGNSYVTLKVYDVIGREVTTLVNEKKDAGRYSVQWNASAFSSGMYIYRLEADGKQEIRKMSMIK